MTRREAFERAFGPAIEQCEAILAEERRLVGLVEAALVADEALGRLGEHDLPSEELSASDRRARDALLAALAGLGRQPDGQVEEVAVVLPDGTIAVRAQSVDGLALIRPDRVHRIGGAR